MTDLERRALLGDREAQKECTEKGIVLPCPFCGSEAKIINLIGAHFVYCEECSASKRLSNSERRAVESWNTRAAQPVGRCGTCALQPVCYLHLQHYEDFDDNAFCSAYEPKEAERKEKQDGEVLQPGMYV